MLSWGFYNPTKKYGVYVMCMTNKAIISQAKSDSRMVYAGQNCGYDSYKLQDWIQDKNAWYEHSSQYFYSQAKSILKESYISNVFAILYPDDMYMRHSSTYSVHNYNDWRQYAREIINHARTNQQGIFAITAEEE